MAIRDYCGVWPKIHENAFIAEGVEIIGDVEIEEDVSIWFGCVLRGDVNSIKIGKGTNVQDGTIIHVDDRDYSKDDEGMVIIGDYVTIGHQCLIHACKVGNKSFVGMGATVMSNAIIKDEGMLGACGLLVERKEIDTHELWTGMPAKFRRKLGEEEVLGLKHSADKYIKLSKRY